MLWLARHTVPHRLAAFIASFLALALATLLITVCGGLLETGIRSDVPPQRLLTAPILVTAGQSYQGDALAERDRLSSSLAGEIAAVPGVGRTVGDVSFPVTVLRGGQPMALPPIQGHGWSSAQLTPYRLISGHQPTAPGDVVIDQGLASRLRAGPGSALDVLAHGTTVPLRVVGIATASAQAPAMFFTDQRAQALLGKPGQVDTIAVFPDSTTSTATVAGRIAAALSNSGVLVLTGSGRGRAEFPGAAGQSTDLIALAAVSGGLMILVAVFNVASTLVLSVQLRRRQIALLRASGATPGQLRRLILSETLLLALPAAGLALLPTQAIGRSLIGAFADHGLVAGRLVYHQGVFPALTGAAIAVLAGVVAALVAARGAIRVRPVEALSAEDTPQRWLTWTRLCFGVLALAGAVALAAVTALVFNGPIAESTAAPSAMVWAISLALLAPAAAWPVLWLLGRVAAVIAPRTGHLAMLTVRGRGARIASMITPVMLAVGLTTAMLYMQTARQAATSQAYGRFLSADLVVSGGGGADGAGGLPLSLSAAASRLPGVAAASPLVTSEGYFDVPPGSDPNDVNSIPLEGLDGADAGQVTDYPVTAGSLRQLTGDSIAICSGCQAPGRDLGDTVAVRFGDNASLRLKIVAVIATPRGFPALFLPANLLAAHTTTGLASQILIATTPGADMTALRNDLRALAPGVEVSGREATLAAFSAQQESTNWVEYLLIAAVVVYAVVSLVSSTVAASRQRRPHLRMLGLIGADRGQVARTVTIEAIMISLAGVVLGTVVALATLLPFDSALGVPGLPAGPIWIYLTVTASATVLTVGTVRLTAWRRRYLA